MDRPATPDIDGSTMGSVALQRPLLDMRPASLNDLPYMAGQILDGARKGHFEKRILTSPQTELLYQELEAIIRHRRRLNGPLGATALIFSNGRDPVGHAILTEIQGTPGIEIYALALDERRRGTGLGSAMLDLLIARFLPQAGAMYARCFPRSVVMYEMLVSRGFEYMLTLRSGLRVLCLKPQPAHSRSP